MAFQGMGETDRAIRSLRLALSQAPDFPEARRALEDLGMVAWGVNPRPTR